MAGPGQGVAPGEGDADGDEQGGAQRGEPADCLPGALGQILGTVHFLVSREVEQGHRDGDPERASELANKGEDAVVDALAALPYLELGLVDHLADHRPGHEVHHSKTDREQRCGEKEDLPGPGGLREQKGQAGRHPHQASDHEHLRLVATLRDPTPDCVADDDKDEETAHHRLEEIRLIEPVGEEEEQHRGGDVHRDAPEEIDTDEAPKARTRNRFAGAAWRAAWRSGGRRSARW